jgi:hypothetical protein
MNIRGGPATPRLAPTNYYYYFFRLGLGGGLATSKGQQIIIIIIFLSWALGVVQTNPKGKQFFFFFLVWALGVAGLPPMATGGFSQLAGLGWLKPPAGQW